MVSLQESDTYSPGRFQISRPYYTPPPSSSAYQKHLGRSMRTIRSSFSQSEYSNSCSFATDSVIDVHLQQLSKLSKASSSSDEYCGLSQVFSDYSNCSSDVSGELERLACLPEESYGTEPEPEPEPCVGFLQRESFSTEIIDNISPEDLQPIVEDGGIPALVEVIEDGASVKRKEFAVVTLIQLCEGVNGVRNRVLLVGEGVIPPLVALSQTGTARAKHKAETLLGYLREARQDGCSSSPK